MAKEKENPGKPIEATLESIRETRVRIGGKQTSKGGIQLDFTVEAQDVKEAKQLLSDSLDAACEVLVSKKMLPTHMAGK